MQTVRVRGVEAGQRLDKMLSRLLVQAPKGFLYKMIRKKNITLNGKRCSGQERLEEGDEIRLFLSDETIEKFSAAAAVPQVRGIELDIVYEDSHVLFVNKPSGMLSQKAKKEDESLVEYVTAYLLNSGQLNEEELRGFRPSVCNRLDRNTSGLVAAGKSLAGLQRMGEVFRDRSAHKYYLAVVMGEVKGARRISGFLTKDERKNQVFIYQEKQEGSQKIETEYLPLWTNGRITLLRVALITGRSHQIRAHLAFIGHPVLGDGKYGDKAWNEEWKKRYKVDSQLLHSWRMELPKLEEPLKRLSKTRIVAPPPLKLIQVLEGEGMKGAAALLREEGKKESIKSGISLLSARKESF
ncbi:RluA family pseudouridine synthase [Lachnospiraceae bacterium 62-35]